MSCICNLRTFYICDTLAKLIDQNRPVSSCHTLTRGFIQLIVYCTQVWATLLIAIPGLSVSTRRQTVFYLLSAGKDKLYLLLITTLASLTSLPCAPFACSKKYIVNWNTFSLCHFAKVPQNRKYFRESKCSLHLWSFHDAVALKRSYRSKRGS